MTGSETKSPGQIVLGWWSHQIADRQSGKARALAARLRHATAIEALSEPQVHALAQALNLRDAAPLLRLVTVLARVRDHENRPLARRLGGDPPAMSAARFQRLMRAEGEELTAALCRALPMAANKCNVAALGQDLLRWDDTTRARWTFHYFGAPAPESLEETSA
ncbi:type I-E CRISPR-associated protein Cse2/CasB [Tropicimonas sp. IMCC34043]|uniref:type I-E CRISPR-associated protein Cse2/CasB n=1 Tax=Tropicimonas sp. IMCC34043 TaxID=2248760 RepID=UPI000E230E62|nr:type I-E CRISPR-associated protein Cse2/CasB [Tropicimonas sp. IMCC34043]